MSVSSGTVSLFASAAFFIAAAAGAAYGLKHKDEVKRAIAEIVGAQHIKVASQADGNNIETAEPSEASGDVTLHAKDGGHFETAAEINGRDVDVMVDTGATLVALTYEDAERAGIYLKASDFTQSVSTANGTAKVAPVEISSISIGDITVRNIRGAVAERGKLQRTLLGMTFLGRLSRVEMRKDALVLHE
jgi:aspartyl protease family protein